MGYTEKELFKAIDHIYGSNNRIKDFKEFLFLCKASAFQGEMRSQYILGIFYELGIEGLENYFEIEIQADDKWYKMIDYKKALEWYEKSANQGYNRAQYRVGYIYYKGVGVNTDYIKACNWFKKSKTENACFYLGYIYEKGLGVEIDYIESIRW